MSNSKSPQTFNAVSKDDENVAVDDLNLRSFTFTSDYDHHQSPVKFNPCYSLKYRILVVLITITITIISQLVDANHYQLDCINDPGHNFTQDVNELIHDNKSFATSLQIISSVLMDAVLFVTIIYWVLYTRNIRFFFALYCFYIIRFLHLQMLQFKYPSGYYWEDNGLPGIVNKYGNYSDFFFSGHVGFLVLNALEWRKVGKIYIFYLLMLISFYQAFVVISFRIHYTVDVPAGYVYAHWIYRMTCQNEIKIEYFNKKLFSWLTTFCIKKKFYSEQIKDQEIKDQIHIGE